MPSAGSYRLADVEITGAKFQPPESNEVQQLVQRMMEIYQSSLTKCHPLLMSAWLHCTFTGIHPFEDGNGRTGRFLQDYVLLKTNYFPTGIPGALRDDYYDALEAADGGDWNPLCQMLCSNQLKVLTRVRAIIDEVNSRGDFIRKLVEKASDKRTGTLHKQYVVWKYRMQLILDQLVELTNDISAASDMLYVRSDRYDIISFEKWQTISERGRAVQNWALRQTWYYEGTALYKTILFFKRHEFRADDIFPKDDLYGNVSLFLAGGDPKERTMSFLEYSDPAVRFREAMFVNDKMCLLSAESREVLDSGKTEEKWTCAELTETTEFAKFLVQDVYERKLGAV